jgi:site-specific DNA recombinase
VTRRRGGWAPSAIAGDPQRGVGILNNAIYTGRDIWNRSRWIKDPDTGMRRAVPGPQSEWIIHEVPELRLISDSLWKRVKARQARRSAMVGDKIRKRLKQSLGRAPRYLFSGILKCKVCGSNYVMADARAYACSGFVNGKVCGNNQRVSRVVLEERLLGSIKADLLSDESIEKFKKRLVRALRQPRINASRMKKLEAEIQNLTDVLAQGVRSEAILTRLQGAESDLTRLRAANTVIDMKAVMALLPAAIRRYRAMVANLEKTAGSTSARPAKYSAKCSERSG